MNGDGIKSPRGGELFSLLFHEFQMKEGASESVHLSDRKFQSWESLKAFPSVTTTTHIHRPTPVSKHKMCVCDRADKFSWILLHADCLRASNFRGLKN